jgi:hypothetical protein
MVEGELGFAFTSLRFDPTAAVLGVGGIDEWSADVALRVGVTDWLQLEAGTSFSLDYVQRRPVEIQGIDTRDIRPSTTSWQRVVPFRLSLLALDTEAVDTAVAVTLPFVGHGRRDYSFRRANTVVVETPGAGRVLPAVELEAPTRWRINDWLWFRAGENLFSVTTFDTAALFAFDFGLGVQPHQTVAVTLDSRIAAIAFDGDGNDVSETVCDRGTIDLEGTWAPLPYFDLVGSLGMPNIGLGFDNWVTRIAVRVRL